MVSQKCRYALRAIFELARREGQGPVKIAQIAEAQAIPQRFLEVILSQLKQGGFVESRRGNEGGYILLREPGELTVREVIAFIEGPVGPVECVAGAGEKCPLRGDCVFMPMWEKAHKAILKVYEETTIRTLLDAETRMCGQYAENYSI